MSDRRLLTVALGCVVLVLTAALSLRSAGRADARTVYQALSEQHYAYEIARHAEAEGVAALADLQDRDEARREAEVQFGRAEQALAGITEALLPVATASDFCAELLEPVLLTIRAERARLLAALDALRGGTSRPEVFRQSSTDPFDSAMESIRQRWGLRQRMWRGRPLTI